MVFPLKLTQCKGWFQYLCIGVISVIIVDLLRQHSLTTRISDRLHYVLSANQTVLLFKQETYNNSDTVQVTSPSHSSAHKTHKDQSLFWTRIDEDIETMQMEPLDVDLSYRSPCWTEPLHQADPYPSNNHIYIKYFSHHKTLISHKFKELFKSNVAVYKKQLKNNATSLRVRCLPYFYLIGVNRGGSSSLWSAIRSHPLVLNGGVMKELHYWNEIRTGEHYNRMGYGQFLPTLKNIPTPRPLKAYIDVFDKTAMNIKTHTVIINGSVYHPHIIGEGTPTYLTDFGGWDKMKANYGYSEPKYILAHILKMITPNIKIIVSLRDPVQRLISEYLSYRREDPKSATDFDTLARKAIELMTECLQNRTMRSCVYDLEIAKQTQPLILKHSMYFPFIKDWKEVFGDQCLIVRSEDYFADTTKVTHQMYKFLGLSVQKMKVGRKINQTPSARKRTKLYPETLNMLYSFFEPYNIQLSQYLGDNRFLWKAHSPHA